MLFYLNHRGKEFKRFIDFIMILLLISLSLWLKNITLYGMSVNPHTR